jgi:2-oxoglutarate dehydrogenase E2 component (dihydrolipoamide succinyltransferase)
LLFVFFAGWFSHAVFCSKVGDQVAVDQLLFSIETDKATAPVNSPQAGVVTEILVGPHDTVAVGAPLLKLGPVGAAAPAAATAAKAPAASAPAPDSKTKTAPPPPGAKKPAAATPSPSPSSSPSPSPSPAPQAPPAPPAGAQPAAAAKKPAVAAAPAVSFSGAREDKRERLSKMRRVIAQRLKDSQNTYVMLTTFQECDMSALFSLREKYGEAFAKKHGGIKLGFMSAFVKVCSFVCFVKKNMCLRRMQAAATALRESPEVNGVIDGEGNEQKKKHFFFMSEFLCFVL